MDKEFADKLRNVARRAPTLHADDDLDCLLALLFAKGIIDFDEWVNAPNIIKAEQKQMKRRIGKRVNYISQKNDSDFVAIVANNYINLIKFVLKKMKIKKIDEIVFSLGDYEEIIPFVICGKTKTEIDFDIYVEHDDLVENEMKCEIDSLLNIECSKQDVLKILNEYDFHTFAK